MSTGFDREESLIRGLLPWLNRQLGERLQWLGKPDKGKYISACEPVRLKAQKHLDGEIKGPNSCIALEHTEIQTFPEQRRAAATFKPLRELMHTIITPLVPMGNKIDILVKASCLREGMNRRKVEQAIHSLRAYLEKWCRSMPKNPSRRDTIRGFMLEERGQQEFDGLKVYVRRSLWPNRRKAGMYLIPDPEFDKELDKCVSKALEDKIQGKAETYQLYREGGWNTMLVMELGDFQLASLRNLADSFRRFSCTLDISSLDYVVLVDHTLGDPMECCWAYKDKLMRTEEEQNQEICDCFDGRPSS